MNKQVLDVYKKEIRELMRDRRVRSSAIIGPFLMVFSMMAGLGAVIKTATAPTNLKMHVVKSGGEAPFTDLLRAAGVQIVDIESMDEGKQLLTQGKSALVVQFPEGLIPGQKAIIQTLLDGKSERSQLAERALEKVVDLRNGQELDKALSSHDISKTIAQPYEIKSEDVKKGKGANQFLLSMIPYLVVFLAFVGGVSAASDIVAGEKERNTLETLLISPVPRTRIVFGKFLSLATICMMSSLSGLIGILISTSAHLPGSDVLMKGGAGITLPAVLSILLVMIPTVALFASVLIAISSFARNTREAQTYLSLGSIVVVIPSVFSQFLGFTDLGSSHMINMIPILNASAAIRNALMGTLDATSLLITAGVSTAIALIAITIAVKLCNREEVLLRI